MIQQMVWYSVHRIKVAFAQARNDEHVAPAAEVGIGEVVEAMAERRVEVDPWVIAGIGVFVAFMIGGVLYAAINGWFGPWLQGLLTKITGAFS